MEKFRPRSVVCQMFSKRQEPVFSLSALEFGSIVNKNTISVQMLALNICNYQMSFVKLSLQYSKFQID